MSVENLSPGLVALLERPLVGVLGTTTPSGAPHLAAVWFAFRDGVFVISTGATSRKALNVEANPVAEICVNEGALGPCVTARGTATIAGPIDVTFIEALAYRYLGEDGGARYMASRDSNSESVLLELRPASWRVWDMGGGGR